MPRMGPMRPMPRVPTLVLLLVLSGCASVVQIQAERAQPMPADRGPIPVDVAMFPECQVAAEFAFSGEATLAALGLGELAGGPDATRPGMIWITAEPVVMPMPEPAVMPVPAGGGKGFAEMPAQRMICVQWPDGSGMSTTVPDDWQLPSDIGDVATTSATGSAEPLNLGPVAVLVAIAVLIGASLVAFRREAPG
jgi:hypothetical protein